MGTIRDKGQVIRDAATARVFAQQKVRVMTLPYNTSITRTSIVHIRHHNAYTYLKLHIYFTTLTY